MSGHVVSTKLYFTIFFTLLVLTGITVAVAFLDLGPLNTVAALGIAVLKATLVLLYFRHLRYSDRLTSLVIGASFVWLAILIGLTLSDFVTRPWIPVPGK